MAKKKETVMVICGHNDDQIIGVGGTIAKYAQEGIKVYTVIASYGELSHPHLKPEIITKKRVKESRESDKVLGGAGVFYLGMREKEFLDKAKDEDEREKIKHVLKELIEKYKPSKIFTHSGDDPHIIHRKLHGIVMEIVDETIEKEEVYSFDVWNPIKVKERVAPKMVVDISKTFSKKIEALKLHESQKMTMMSLLWHIYLKAIMNGWSNSCRYAEVFYRLN